MFDSVYNTIFVKYFDNEELKQGMRSLELMISGKDEGKLVEKYLDANKNLEVLNSSIEDLEKEASTVLHCGHRSWLTFMYNIHLVKHV